MIGKCSRLVAALAVGAAAIAAVAGAATFSGWSTAVSAEAAGATADLNTVALEGCPALSRDGRSLYFASNRAGGLGGLDIWVAQRERVGDAWDAPVNAGAAINTAADEFCPSPLRNGHGFLFVSTRAGGCGGADIYATRDHPTRGWAEPQNLGCAVNSAADEASPSLVPSDDGTVLYFSSTRPGGVTAEPPTATAGDSDIYVSGQATDGSFAAPALAPGLNTRSNESRPNVRRDGLEIFFDSNRAGTFGSADIWSAARASTADSWDLPQNLGPQVNSAAPDTRPFLSWDATTLYFGSARAGSEGGSSDIYVTTRSRVAAP